MTIYPGTESLLNIGRLSELTGCSVPTIRYYEEIGLLPEARRRASGHRMYDDSSVELLTFVRHCRDFGFPIDDIKALISISSSSERDCGETRQVAQAHLDTVRAKMTELTLLEKSLTKFVESCSDTCNGGPARHCTILKDILQPMPATATNTTATSVEPIASASAPAAKPGRCCG